MSKSDPEDTFISLLDPPDAIRRKVRRAPVTDSEADIRFDPENKPGVSNLLSIIAALTGQSVEEAAAELQGQRYGKLKDRVSECVIETLAPPAKRAQAPDGRQGLPCRVCLRKTLRSPTGWRCARCARCSVRWVLPSA